MLALARGRTTKPAERSAIASKEYDRALRSLEKRTHRPGTSSRVRDTVADILAAPTVPFPDHLALLQLSRDSDGRPRLLTTNFDICGRYSTCLPTERELTMPNIIPGYVLHV